MITTGMGSKKIEGSDNWRAIFGAHNDSVEASDDHLDAIQDGLAIVANGDTHPAVASGQYVYVRNHDTLAEGLYKAAAAIAEDALLNTSNLVADGAGGLNDLKSGLDTLNSNMAYKYLPYVSGGTLFSVIKTNYFNGDTCGVFLALNCTDAPESNKTYVIRYTTVNGTQSFTVEASELNAPTNTFITAGSAAGSSLSSWHKIALDDVSTGTITKHSSISGGTLDALTCRKVGNTVYASGRLHSISPAVAASNIFFVIPEGFRPAQGAIVMGYMKVVEDGDKSLHVTVQSSGNVSFGYSATKTTNQVGFAGSWSVL